MDGADIEVLLQRIDRAVARIGTALADSRSRPPANPAAVGETGLRETRLREAVAGAIARIDALIAGAGEP